MNRSLLKWDWLWARINWLIDFFWWDRSGAELKDRNRKDDQDLKSDPAGTSYQLNASFDSTLSSNIHRSDLSSDQISGIQNRSWSSYRSWSRSWCDFDPIIEILIRICIENCIKLNNLEEGSTPQDPISFDPDPDSWSSAFRWGFSGSLNKFNSH